ncbi:ParB N-terminal domain-containing protein [Maribius pontilimi]|uniref:ParB N-terminal domain-containing protein n=1 Tax=Palleronia pontilimi TaxID=1964209 RepID=A0A934MFB6_9RHOB|nr:ParB N-terminal domain-containing protein [Palleronia pontilimi]MBJ3764341.1 ParB N-terminal domain-containing protein [Palleronia pontilimi]
MAKRKRLDPPKTDYLSDSTLGRAPFASAPISAPPPIAGVAGDAAGSAAAAELAQTLSDARAQGRMVVALPLDDIDATYLVRDRVGIDESEMAALVASIRARGQQTPIEVVDLGRDARPRHGLISGWRRLHALRILADQGETVLALALLRSPSEASDAYLSMVEENEIRVNLSYYERARIALKAVEQGAFPDTKKALLSLFHAASRAKRSKIRSFVTVVEALDGTLRFPEALGERTGLRLSKALDADPTLARKLEKALEEALIDDATGEQDAIENVLKGGRGDPMPRTRTSRLSVREGLDLVKFEDGAVHLSGPAIDENFRHAILAWLQEET